MVPEKGINSLEILKDWISREDAKSILVLVGDGGMGKTTLVRQLAMTYKEDRIGYIQF